MAKNREKTRERIYDAKRTTYHRMRVCIDIDVPEGSFERDTFNSASMALVGHIEGPNPENLFPTGCRVMLVTSEDAPR